MIDNEVMANPADLTNVKIVVSEIAKLLQQFYDVQIVFQQRHNSDEQEDSEHVIEANIAQHKDTIIDNLASFNRQNLENMITILESKITEQYTERGDGQQLRELIRAIKVESSKLIERLMAPTDPDAADQKNLAEESQEDD